MRKFVAVGLTVVLLLVTVAGTAFAARGGNRGGNAGAATAACTVTPDPVALGSTYTVAGSGLTPGLFVNVDVSDSVGTQVYMAVVDGTGSLSVSGWTAWSGTNSVAIVDPSGHKVQTLATCSFLVS